MEPLFSNIISAVCWVTILSVVAIRTNIFGKDTLQRRIFTGLWLLKILVGVGVWAIYTFYYTDRTTSDIYRFFADSTVIYNTLFTAPGHYFRLILDGGETPDLLPYLDAMNNWYKSFDEGFVNENRTLIRFNALLMPFTAGSYFGNMVIVCFLGVWGQAFLYRQVLPLVAVSPIFLFVLANLWPSQLFWTSALMKEPLVMASLAFCVGMAVKYKKEHEWKWLVYALVFFVAVLYSKFYVGVALFFPLLTFVCIRQNIGLTKLTTYFAAGIFLLYFSAWGMGKLFPNYDVIATIAYKQQAFANVAAMSNAGSAFYIEPLSPDLWSIITMIPIGMVNAMFRPFPQDSAGVMEWAAVLENLVFILIVVWLALRINLKSPLLGLAMALLIFGLVIFVLGGITVNISGALVRYKMPAIAYWAMALAIVSKPFGFSGLGKKFSISVLAVIVKRHT